MQPQVCVFCVDFEVGWVKKGGPTSVPFFPARRGSTDVQWLYVYVLFLTFCGYVFSLRILRRCSIDSCFQVGYRLSSYWRGFHSPKKASQFNDLLFTMEKYNPCRQTSIVFFNSVFINLEWRSCFYLSLLHQIKRPQQRTWCHRWF